VGAYGQAGDAGQALDPGQSLGNAALDHAVPVLARGDGHGDAAAAAGVGPDPGGGHVHHGSGKALVGHDQVAPAAEDEHRLAGGIRVPYLGDDLVIGARVDEAGGRAANAERRVPGETHLLTHG
jgi:hypothetical protein